MISERRALADAAEALVGTPFRFHGRDPVNGLDCVGVIIASLMAIGRRAPSAAGYALRQTDFSAELALLAEAGFCPANGSSQPGDVVACVPGPAQLHFLVCTGPRRHIHAHALLRRVVAMPGALPWPVAGLWRLGTDA